MWAARPSARGTVRIYLTVAGRGGVIGTLATSRPALSAHLPSVPRPSVQAHFGTEKSLSFSLTPVPDRTVNPFGCGGYIAC